MTDGRESVAEPGDEDLASGLARGDEGALRALHRRFAPQVFAIAIQSLSAPEAEEIVQDTFATIWQQRATYDPARGPIRPWIWQIARNRVANELRRRRRFRAFEQRAASDLEPEAPVPADEKRWEEWRRATVRAAVASLPPAQARALSLAFFEDLSHEQIASMMGVPLGTAKTRIRGGLKRLSRTLATLLALVLGALGVRRGAHWIDLRNRALRVTTSSDAPALRMLATSGVPSGAHATYRARPGDDVAVVTGSYLPALRPGEHYVAWLRRGVRWTRLGELALDRDARAMLIVETPEVTPQPDALQVTLETTSAPSAPSARAIVAWGM